MTINMQDLFEAKKKWFSAKVFLATLAVLVIFLWLATGGDRKIAHELGALGVLPITAMVTLLAIFSLAHGEWRPDPRPFKERPYISGQAWVSMSLAMSPITIFLLLLH